MFSNNHKNGLTSTSNLLICAANQSTNRPTNLLTNPSVVSQITSVEDIRNKKYKQKCNRLQKQIRRLLFINNAIHSELNQCLNKLSKASDERRFLLNKILRFHKDMNQETISSRILQEALSKKQNTKSSSQSEWSPLISSSQPLTQLNASTECEPLCSQPPHSSQQFCPKTQIEAKQNQSNDWTQISHSVSTESQSSVVSNKRIKLFDSQTTLKKV